MEPSFYVAAADSTVGPRFSFSASVSGYQVPLVSTGVAITLAPEKMYTSFSLM